ncbi:nucleotide-diphospho-sugar transferase [Cristinia sonorae]|uniref:Nucleotide-diphospho-sugar transferase n=1 Tax=Cristinia sonorae TaxID=1940300 RepID=A0A8K0XPX9_9AGAR|nr:nucleotide-diphospho-sugar transferase [Cristinia sonorae]
MSRKVWTTLLTKASYLPGLFVLHETLLSVNSQYPLVVMTTPGLPQEARDVVERRGLTIREVNGLQPGEGVRTMPDLDVRFGDTWTKLRAFDLVEYDRVVLLDSDMIVMKNMDELLDLELPSDWIAAVHACACNPRKYPHYPADWTPENCAHSSVSWPTAISNPPVISKDSPRPYGLLNSGLVVINPSLELSEGLQGFLATSPLIPTFQFPDQDLLSVYFEGRWKVLPWCYNALKTMKFVHEPIWRDDEIRCLHYILAEKPWLTDRAVAGVYQEVNGWWWDEYKKLEVDMKQTDPEGWKLVDAHVTKK